MKSVNGHLPLSTPRVVAAPAVEHLADAATRAIQRRLDLEAAEALDRWLDSSPEASATARAHLMAAAVRKAWTPHEEAPPPLYDDVAHWVVHHFAPIYIRRIQGGVRWCAQGGATQKR